MIKTLSVTAYSCVAAVLLSGCSLLGPSDEELQLEADCDTVFDNAASTHEWGDGVKMDTWPDTYAVTNAGTASREKARRDIDKKFPWIGDAVSELVVQHGWEKLESSPNILKPYTEALALNDLVRGSSVSPAFDPSTISELRSASDGVMTLVGEVRQGIFDKYEPSVLSTCPELTSNSYVDGFEERFSATLQNAQQGSEQMLTILSCETRGQFDGTECAADDFQIDWSDTPSEPRNPFEEPFADDTTQGIAEFAWCWNLGLEINGSRNGCW